MRFYLKAKNNGMERLQYQEYLLNAPVDELFECREAAITVPERARLFSSVVCEKCGEAASEHTIRIQKGKKVCLDCFEKYTRGW
jgi:formylmethanofuran dehydrogenase subunit E